MRLGIWELELVMPMAAKRLIAAPAAAIASIVASLGCCLPFGYLAAAGMAGAGAVMESLRPWLLGLSVVFLIWGFVEQRRGARCGTRPGIANIILLFAAAVVVAAMLLFPQFVAGILANSLSWKIK